MGSKKRMKLLRKIVVNDLKYFWSVVNYELKIWINKKIIFEEFIDTDVIITPKIVREKILMIERSNVDIIKTTHK